MISARVQPPERGVLTGVLTESLLKGFRNVNKCLPRGFLRRGHHHGVSGVAALADFGEKRTPAEEGDILPGGLVPTPAMAKKLHSLAVRRGEIAHVLHDTDNLHV